MVLEAVLEIRSKNFWPYLKIVGLILFMINSDKHLKISMVEG